MSDSKIESSTTQDPGVEKLKLRYVPLSKTRKWEQNPKIHSMEHLIASIERHGFGDPPKYDKSLDSLVYGNGRTEALERMRDAGKPPPRGVLSLDGGEWLIPVIFGVDADSRAAAAAFGLDHNSTTLMGGGYDLTDLLHIWDEVPLQEVLEASPEARDLLVCFDTQDIDSLLNGPDFEPVAAEEQSRLDQKKLATCPECGHEFRP